jgi:hypothetical protein
MVVPHLCVEAVHGSVHVRIRKHEIQAEQLYCRDIDHRGRHDISLVPRVVRITCIKRKCRLDGCDKRVDNASCQYFIKTLDRERHCNEICGSAFWWSRAGCEYSQQIEPAPEVRGHCLSLTCVGNGCDRGFQKDDLPKVSMCVRKQSVDASHPVFFSRGGHAHLADEFLDG